MQLTSKIVLFTKPEYKNNFDLKYSLKLQSSIASSRNGDYTKIEKEKALSHKTRISFPHVIPLQNPSTSSTAPAMALKSAPCFAPQRKYLPNTFLIDTHANTEQHISFKSYILYVIPIRTYDAVDCSYQVANSKSKGVLWCLFHVFVGLFGIQCIECFVYLLEPYWQVLCICICMCVCVFRFRSDKRCVCHSRSGAAWFVQSAMYCTFRWCFDVRNLWSRRWIKQTMHDWSYIINGSEGSISVKRDIEVRFIVVTASSYPKAAIEFYIEIIRTQDCIDCIQFSIMFMLTI